MPQIGETYRTKCGNGRATYQPDWDSVLPWIIYVNGACVAHRGGLEVAKRLLYDYGCNVGSDLRMIGHKPYSKSVVLNETAAWNG